MSLSADDMISYIESPKDSTTESLELLKVVEYKINIQKYENGKLYQKENNLVYNNYRKQLSVIVAPAFNPSTQEAEAGEPL